MVVVNVHGNVWSGPLDLAIVVLLKPVIKSLNSEVMMKNQNPPYNISST